MTRAALWIATLLVGVASWVLDHGTTRKRSGVICIRCREHVRAGYAHSCAKEQAL
jgi:hypothetical protein